MVSIPRAIARSVGIYPGWKLDWRVGASPDELIVRVIPDRAEQGRRLLGKGRRYSPELSGVDGLVAERDAEG
jgi:hypothetical protein